MSDERVLTGLLAAGAQVRAIGGNRPFWLDDPERAWLVLDGALDLFAVRRCGDAPAGPLLHLARITAGGLVTGLAGEAVVQRGGEHSGVLAVGRYGTTLLCSERAQLNALQTEPELAAAIEAPAACWAAQLARIASPQGADAPWPKALRPDDPQVLARIGDRLAAAERQRHAALQKRIQVERTLMQGALAALAGLFARTAPGRGEDAGGAGDRPGPAAEGAAPGRSECGLSGRALLRAGLRGSGRDLARVGAFGLIGGALGLLLPVALAYVAGSLIPTDARGPLFQLASVLIVAVTAGALFEYARGIALVRISARLSRNVQHAVWARLLSLPADFFRRHTAGDLADRALGYASVQRTLTNTVVTAAFAGISSLFALGLMIHYDPALAGCGLVLAALHLGSAAWIARRLLPMERALAQVHGRLEGLVPQLITGIAKLRAAGAERRTFARWSSEYLKGRRLALRIGALTNRVAAVDAALPAVAMMAILVLVAERGRPLPVADLLGFCAAYGQFSSATSAVSLALTQALGAVPVYERMKPILQTEPESASGRKDPGELSGAIALRSITFGYNSSGPPALRDVSIHCEPGEFVAIVGESGSGKSTLFRLLLGFERPESGVVEFDSHDLAELDLGAVRRQMGVVLQHGKLIPGDVFTNIAGASELTLDAAWNAARLAGISEEIERMPMGMRTIVTDGGSTFSAGQRQRLLIARAVASRPRVVLLDEATSALDNRTQALVMHNLGALQATRMVIAQRLSTIQRADRIYVMAQGRIVQTGTYEELLAEAGPFTALARRQLA